MAMRSCSCACRLAPKTTRQQIAAFQNEDRVIAAPLFVSNKVGVGGSGVTKTTPNISTRARRSGPMHQTACRSQSALGSHEACKVQKLDQCRPIARLMTAVPPVFGDRGRGDDGPVVRAANAPHCSGTSRLI